MSQLTSDNPADRLLQPVNMQFVSEEMLEEPPAPPAMGNDNESESEAKPVNPKEGGAGEAEKNNKEIKKYFLRYSPIFSDAFNRIQARNKKDEKDFQRAFSPVLTSIAAAFSFDPAAENQVLSEDLASFVREYITGMAKRSELWKNDLETVTTELTRAITSIRDKSGSLQADKSKQEQEENV
jgi:hypothetical protein